MPRSSFRTLGDHRPRRRTDGILAFHVARRLPSIDWCPLDVSVTCHMMCVITLAHTVHILFTMQSLRMCGTVVVTFLHTRAAAHGEFT